MTNNINIKAVDKEVYEALIAEEHREQDKVLLIASENYVSRAVLEAQGSVLTNKYAEGYPGKRYYGGCEFSDIVETLAIDRAKDIFNAEHVNVQPHSGSQANMAVFLSMLKPGDTVMGMSLSHGGHLTHGSSVSFSGQIYKSVSYGISKDTGLIDFDEVLELALKHKPKLIICGASAYSRTIDFAAFAEVASSIGAYLMADIAHIAGLIAAGIHPSPIPYAEFVTSTTHKTLRGPRGGMIMCRSEFAKQIDKVIFPGIQGGPLMHVIAAKAVAFKEAQAEAFKTYQNQVVKNARVLAEELMLLDFNILSGGTDNHLMLLDLRNFNVTGKDAEETLDLAGITANKNSIPHDDRPARITSGIRLGTPSVTTRGMKEPEMIEIAGAINDVIKQFANKNVIQNVIQKNREKMKTLCERFPIY